MASKTCVICGKPLTATNHGMFSKKCTKCAQGKSPEAIQNAIYGSFDREQLRSVDEIRARPVSATLPKLVVGSLIANACFVIPSTLIFREFRGSWVFLLLGLWIVTKTVFRAGNPLDQFRWRRYWRGECLGYFLALISLIGLEVATNSNWPAAVTFIGACAVGFCVGFVNVWRTDAHDRSTLGTLFLEWQAAKSGKPLSASAISPPVTPPISAHAKNAPPQTRPSSSHHEKLEHLKGLFQKGLISSDDYEARKKQILDEIMG